MKKIEEIVKKIQTDTNQVEDITYQKKIVLKKQIYIIYNESLTGSDKISDFIVKSLEKINKQKKKRNILETICNNIDNFKIKKISNYQDICYFLNYGFTILLIENSNYALALETKRNLARSISIPQTENTIRASMDAFVEDMQTNIGLIRRRIKTNSLWIDSLEIGKYTSTKVNILYIKGIFKKKYLNIIKQKLNKIEIDGIISSGNIKNLIEKENKCIFPTVITTERPDRVCRALLNGKIIILVDCSPFAIILPVCLNDFFLSTEDAYSKSINISMTRIIRYTAFFITLLTPAIYIAITTYDQEILPSELLISIASQRATVPFPAFFEAIVMMSAFEILKECDLRLPTFTTSALSIVGALILGEAAVNAGIVSPIMIIVIAITAVSGLLITEPELINGIRWYRLFFMLGANFLGIFGILVIFLLFITKLTSLESFGLPYLYPLAPTEAAGLKNSIIKFPIKNLNKRQKVISNNIIRFKEKTK